MSKYSFSFAISNMAFISFLEEIAPTKIIENNIIVFMDDDDYYPPTRVEHAVTMLKQSPSSLIAGSSELFIYFKTTIISRYSNGISII